MKNNLLIMMTMLTLFLNSCTGGQPQQAPTSLTAAEFAAKMKELPGAPVIDVRTPGEFEGGYINRAQNIDWNGNDFESNIAVLDKSAPVFVYCQSGGRSASAANKMRSIGFKEVYELEGGMMKWRAANFPEAHPGNAETPTIGMTKNEFEKLITSDKVVLVDFYADWCAPCKKMKPYLDEIATQMADSVFVVRLNADEHPELYKALNIDALPVLHIYRNNTLTWQHTGYIDKSEVVKILLANN